VLNVSFTKKLISLECVPGTVKRLPQWLLGVRQPLLEVKLILPNLPTLLKVDVVGSLV
jgi:hypothetical protein